MKVLGAALFAVFLSPLLLGSVALASPDGSGYHLVKSVPLGAAPGAGEYFDYITVDAVGRRVYFAHGSEVKVLDADNFSVVGSITGLKRCHGVALVPELNKGFITDGEAGKVMVFDMKTLKITGEIKTYPDTDSLIYDPSSKLVFTFNGSSKNSSVIDPVKETMIKTIEMGGGVEQPIVDGNGTLYDNNEDTSDVVVVDTHALVVKTRWSVKPAGGPVGLALDLEHHRLFSAGREPAKLVMMDTDSGKVLQSFPISDGVDGNIYIPASGLVFSSTRAGVLHVFHEDSPDKLTPVEEIKTQYGAKTIAFDPTTQNVFLITSDFTPPTGKKGEKAGGRKAIQGTARVLIYGR
jgi:DNA-binding beta-propeller fold protein YncE